MSSRPGGSPIFRHTYRFFRAFGLSETEVDLKIGFGKGESSFWTNTFTTPVTQRHAADIRRFGWLLWLMRFFEWLLGLVPIYITLSLFRFSTSFQHKII